MGQVHIVDSGADPGAWGAGPPIVLLHQTPRSVDEFAEVLPLLAQHRRTIAIDTPGYGCSDHVSGQPSVPDYAAAIVDVLDALDVPRAIFVGHHTGAVIAVELAAAFADRVDRVVLSGPVYTDEKGRAELSQFFKQWRIEGDGAHLKDKWDKFFKWLPDPRLTQRFVVDLFRAGETSEQGHFAVALYRMEDRIGLVKCPALLIYNREDPFASPEASRPVKDAFKPATEIHLAAGVFVANEKPELFAKTVLDYISRA
jgi:pimeloyl-ACP methyl ester carboxylesterase